MKNILIYDPESEKYISIDGITIGRESGRSPNGNPMNGRWVLRKRGRYIDMDQFRNDLAERHNLDLQGVE